MNDTIAAIATAPGRAGVAVVRVSGPDAFAIAEEVAGSPIKVGVRFVRMAIDECLILGFKAPKSYTGEDTVEFQCHGGAVTPRRVLEALFAAGARLARRGEFTERAFLNGKLDYDQAESVLDLINAKTDKAADRALEGLQGKKTRELKALYERVLRFSSVLEHALDVSEEELPPSFFDEIDQFLRAIRQALDEAIKRIRESRLLRDGALVVLSGPPNAGKSSLMNALLGRSRAIVSDIPGTTRDSIEEWLEIGGYPIRLVDTAGLRESDDAIEAEGVKRAEALRNEADIVLALDEGFGLKVHAKCDLHRGEGLNVSAKTGEGIEELKSAIVAELDRRSESDEVRGDECDPTLPVLLAVRESLKDERDLVLFANIIRSAAEAIGSLIGATYSEDLLSNLFNRFCVGK